MSFKKLSLVFVLLAFLFGAPALSSQQIKIGYVDTDRLQMEYKEWTDVKAKLDQQQALWREYVDSLQQEIINLQDELRTQTGLLNVDARRQ